MDVTLAIKKHRAKLEQMILDNKDYNEIVKQSQKLDKYHKYRNAGYIGKSW